GTASTAGASGSWLTTLGSGAGGVSTGPSATGGAATAATAGAAGGAGSSITVTSIGSGSGSTCRIGSGAGAGAGSGSGSISRPISGSDEGRVTVTAGLTVLTSRGGGRGGATGLTGSAFLAGVPPFLPLTAG